jgi:hypothetical protein
MKQTKANIAIDNGKYYHYLWRFERWGGVLPPCSRQRGGDDVVQEGQTMSEGRAQILEMLVAGRVTVEQADQLLQALDAASPAAPHEPAAQLGRQRRRDERADDFFATLTPEQLIELHDHGVSRAFIEQMRAAGLYGLSVADLIDLYDHGVTPRFVLDLREAGFAELTGDDLVELYDHGVDAAFVREMQEVGLAAATPDQLVEMYDHGVDAAFVREMRDLGFVKLAPSEWVELRDHGVDSDFGREMHSQHPTSQGRWDEPGE